MGIRTSKPPRPKPYASKEELENYKRSKTPPNGLNHDSDAGNKTPIFPFYSPSPARYFFSKKSPAPSPATPRRFFKLPFPPPSPAKHIKAVLARRRGAKNAVEAIPEGEQSEGGVGLDKSFGLSKQFTSRYEVGEEVGRGHFGYTCSALSKKGDLKGQQVAVKVIPKSKALVKSRWLLLLPTGSRNHIVL